AVSTVGDGTRGGDTQGIWPVLAGDGSGPGQVSTPQGLAWDGAGNLYVAESLFNDGRIQQRDAQGHWSVLTSRYGDALGEVVGPSAVVVDSNGNLYVEDQFEGGRIQQRDAQGSWSLIATHGSAPGQVYQPSVLAMDPGGTLYVAEGPNGNTRIQQRDAQGSWSVLTTPGLLALAVDTAGKLYVADWGYPARIWQRD